MAPMRRLAPWCGMLLLALLVRPLAAGDDAVADLAKRLRSGTFEQRLAALDALEALGPRPEVEKAVVPALDDPEWEVQIRAARALGTVGGEAARRALIQRVLLGEIFAVRTAAAAALGSLGREEAAETLLKLARTSKDESAKERALRAVGRLGAVVSAETMAGFLNARGTGTVEAAADALARLRHDDAGTAHVLKALQGLLKERGNRGEFRRYAAAVDALARIDAPAARRQAVREVLLQEDDDPYVPNHVALGLAAQPPGDVEAALTEAFRGADKPVEQVRLARLCAALPSPGLRPQLETWTTSSQPRVRWEAARALGRLGEVGSQRPLERLLDDREPRVVVEAVGALARCLPREAFRALAERVRKEAPPEARVQYAVELHDHGDPAGVAALRPLLEDPDWRAATAAICALGSLGADEDLPLLEPLVGKGDWRRRGAVFEALGRLRTRRAVPLLIEGLSDKDPLVRGVSLTNLQILTRQRLVRPDAWRAWWEQHGPALEVVKRSRRTPEERAKEAEERDNAFYAHEFEKWRERAVEVLKKSGVLVTIGAWDKVERVLEHLQIPFTLLRAQELKETGLNPSQVLLVNCEGTQDREGKERIQWFVNVGGYLLTTDWALIYTVTPCFPGYLERFEGFTTGNDVVAVQEAAPRHPWTRGVFEGNPRRAWWLEIQAFPVTVADPSRCQVLLESPEMRQKYGTSPLGVEFRFGLGHVQHSSSHFFLQEEGYGHKTQPRERAAYLADDLGVPLPIVRRLAAAGDLAGPPSAATLRELSPHYSMFRLIVNVVKDKADWIEDL